MFSCVCAKIIRRTEKKAKQPSNITIAEYDEGC